MVIFMATEGMENIEQIQISPLQAVSCFAAETVLRAPDCKYQKSYDRQENSDFILFHLNVLFGELFLKKHN